jgi:hypothetical protein
MAALSVSPPFRKASRVSSEKPPFSLPYAWHLMHAASKSGWMSLTKSAVRTAGGGKSAAFATTGKAAVAMSERVFRGIPEE